MSIFEEFLIRAVSNVGTSSNQAFFALSPHLIMISDPEPLGPSVRGISGWILGSEVCREYTQVSQSTLTDTV